MKKTIQTSLKLPKIFDELSVYIGLSFLEDLSVIELKDYGTKYRSIFYILYRANEEIKESELKKTLKQLKEKVTKNNNYIRLEVESDESLFVKHIDRALVNELVTKIIGIETDLVYITYLSSRKAILYVSPLTTKYIRTVIGLDTAVFFNKLLSFSWLNDTTFSCVEHGITFFSHRSFIKHLIDNHECETTRDPVYKKLLCTEPELDSDAIALRRNALLHSVNVQSLLRSSAFLTPMNWESSSSY